MIIHPYKLGSRSVKRIKAAMNASQDRRVVSILTKPPKGNGSLIINWGASEITYPEGKHWIINSAKDVRCMSDKVLFFERTGHEESFLNWTTSRETAISWGSEGCKVFARLLTRGSGGRGIDVWSTSGRADCPIAPLYTKHQPKTHEYRLHMARSLTGSEFEPILIQRKVWTHANSAPVSWDVRSHDNGFIFQSYPTTDGVVGSTKVPIAVLSVARRAMASFFPEMHFSALDILYHQPTDKAVVCEGNTAPGLENNTVDVYAHYFLGLNEEFRKERRVVI